jgi:hypothetical protein
MGRMVLAGPPWCHYIDDDEAYLRGQLGQVGSGLLSGAELPEHVVAEIREEARRIVARRAQARQEFPRSPEQDGRAMSARAA